jgi:hypothetical protein
MPRGGAYVRTFFVLMYAPLRIRRGADMPKNGTAAPSGGPAGGGVLDCSTSGSNI